MEYRLGICDEDYHYVVNLMEFVNSCKDSPLRLVAFSSPESMEEYLEKFYLDGVILGEGMCLLEKEDMKVLYLTEDIAIEPDDIYKYQSAEEIIMAILRCLNVTEKRDKPKDKSFVAVYSPLGRCGKTSLAKGLGMYHSGSLYIAMEEFGRRDSLGEDIFYHILLQNHNIKQLLNKLKSDDYGLVELTGLLSYLDIRQLKREHLEWFKELVVEETQYSKVIFDIGAGVLSDILLLDVMDLIYVPVLEDENNMVKLYAFRELLRRKEYQGIAEKLVYINVPQYHFGSEDMRSFIREGEL